MIAAVTRLAAGRARDRRSGGKAWPAVRWKGIALLVLGLSCGGCQVTDMIRFSYDNAKATHNWAGVDHETSVPFTLIDNHIILPVRINGSEPMNFVLDSGAGASVIMDSRRTRSLGLQASSQIGVSGVGAGPDPVANIVRNATLAVGSLRLEGLSVVHLPIDSVPFFFELDDVYFDGVIGAPFFERFSIAIDYDARLVTFSDPPATAAVHGRGDEWTSIPLQIEDGVPYVRAQVTNAQGVEVTVKLLADTGAREALSLTPNTHAGLRAPTKYFETVSKGLSGDIVSHVTMLGSFAVGPYRTGELPVSFALAGGETENNSNGILGNALLSRFNLVFDYSNEQLLLTPNRRFAEPLLADRSGLLIRPHRRGAIVRDIAPDSAAAYSSIKVGDIITSFDAFPVQEQSVGDLKQALASGVESVELCWWTGVDSMCETLVLASRFRSHAQCMTPACS